MHRPLLLVASAKLNRIHLVFKVLLAIVAGHVIVVFGEEESFFDLIEQNLYIPAFIGSVLIAFSMIESVFRVTALLERKYDWGTSWLTRSAWQFLVGILGITVLSVVEAVIYFKLRGTHVLDTRYFALDFLPIALFVTTLNACYCFLCHLGLGLVPQEEREEERPTAEPMLEEEMMEEKLAVEALLLEDVVIPQEQNSPPFLAEAEEQTIFTDDFIANLCYVYIANNVRIAVDGEHSETVVDLSMEAIISALPPSDFMMNNQSFIINRKIIEDVQPATSRRFKLVLKPPFDKLTNDDAFIASQRCSPAFRKWWFGNDDKESTDG